MTKTDPTHPVYHLLAGRIRSRSCRVVVAGLGIVGLTTAVSFARAGFPTTGYDIDERIVTDLKNAKIASHERGMSSRLRTLLSTGVLQVTNDGREGLDSADAIIVCVPTPLTNKRPDLHYLVSSVHQIGKSLLRGSLVCIASTVPPLTTRQLVKPMLENTSHLVCGEDFWLSYCPERVIPGNALEEFNNNAKVIGGYDSKAILLSKMLFSRVTRGQLCSTDCTTAEIVKVAENTIRDVDIAFANQLALICEKVGVNVGKVIDHANTHPRVRILRPGPGVGGACLPKDPYMLVWPYGGPRISSDLILAARRVNDHMPTHMVRFVLRKLGGPKEAAKRSIAVLGTAYKGNTGDTRNSPAEPIIRKLLTIVRRVVSYDPYTGETFGSVRGRDLESTIQEAPFILILADHDQFRALNFGHVKGRKTIFDLRNMMDREKLESRGHRYFGLASA